MFQPTIIYQRYSEIDSIYQPTHGKHAFPKIPQGTCVIKFPNETGCIQLSKRCRMHLTSTTSHATSQYTPHHITLHHTTLYHINSQLISNMTRTIPHRTTLPTSPQPHITFHHSTSHHMASHTAHCTASQHPGYRHYASLTFIKSNT